MKERKLPATSYAVLGLLSFGEELSGYDLKKWADASLRFFYWSPAISNIYAELKRLQELGLVEARVAQDDLRNKRVFHITDAGLDALRAWVEQAPVEPPVLKDQALLRVWLGHMTEPDFLLRLVEAEEVAAERQIGELSHNLAASQQNPAFAYPALVEEWCLRQTHARKDALAELRRALEQRSPAP